MKILTIGGTGFISSRTVVRLLEAGHEVTIFSRGKSGKTLPARDRLKFISGDRRKEVDLKQTLQGNSFDAVFDFVAYQPMDSQIAAKVFRGKIDRFIHCSTISVYMVSSEVQCPVTEDQDKLPLMPFWDRNPFGMEYGIQKRRCEDALWQAHDEKLFPVSMLRPTYVCGPEDPVKRDFFWIERILDGGPLLIPGGGDFAFQSVYVEDVARAFVNLLELKNSIGKAYNVVGEEIFSLNDYLKRLCRLLDRQPQFVHIEQGEFDKLAFSTNPSGDVFPFNTRRTAVFSLDKIKRDLNFRSTSFEQWNQRTIDWYLNTYNGHSNGYNRRDEEMEFAKKWIKNK